MRKLIAVAIGIAALGICLPALAQNASPQQASTFWTGVNPRNITTANVPVMQPGKGLKNYQINNALHKPSTPSAFNLSNVFPKISLGSWPPKVPNVPFMSQKSNPFQPTPPQGVNLFNPSIKK